MNKRDNLKSILSEGEQKSVALALFIAESKLQLANQPIILDDPVNSLDHKIAANFADRLLSLDNQVIVFTHNKLFLDVFITAKVHHICKTINTDCGREKGKHIYHYEIQSDGREAKGVINHEAKENNAKSYIDSATELLKISPFNKSEEVSTKIRKAVEHSIDEFIFLNLVPNKYSNKNNRIQWSDLKKLSQNEEVIDKLSEIHSRVSGGSLHLGIEHDANPIEKEEYMEMIEVLKEITMK